ncbi:polysaccharide pyruvyl transferase family protein [Wenzhouxiangella sp. XN24]|uniref:polysaccharide pyruvyl transferase family protein n=1 Tax=Wenzhouxiangella sp. XN24 TaxID=2713569 RepID=UPI0013EAE9CD|nr:polysaccharide pyruvyl transferase family protein [Wenzhouxiangella sp. XN24]NGX17016.1 polysaccharide pyruvyl transferase family protein [Wenzhouxiangella sp. XN24]
MATHQLTTITKSYVKHVQYSIEDKIFPSGIRLDWVRDNNFGDVLNPILINWITNRRVLHTNPAYYDGVYLSAIGSICQRARPNTIIWGSGFISESAAPLGAPRKIHAVRGPRSRQIFDDLGVSCPEIYGDPALLTPKFYKPPSTKSHKYGVVPHYTDLTSKFIQECIRYPNIKVINPLRKNPLEVISDIVACEKIASSSLHGLIIGDAYGVETMWIEIGQMLSGGAFKFHDYYESIGIKGEAPLPVSRAKEISALSTDFRVKPINLDLEKLLQAFPTHAE